jgi:hypothetical protein
MSRDGEKTDEKDTSVEPVFVLLADRAEDMSDDRLNSLSDKMRMN